MSPHHDDPCDLSEISRDKTCLAPGNCPGPWRRKILLGPPWFPVVSCSRNESNISTLLGSLSDRPVSSDRHVLLEYSAGSPDCRLQPLALHLDSLHVGHIVDGGLSEMSLGSNGLTNLLVELLLFVRVGGQVIQQEGGSGAGSVDASHHHIHRHDEGYRRVSAALSKQFSNDRLAVLRHVVYCVLDVLGADVELFFSQPGA